MAPAILPRRGQNVAICEVWGRDGIQGWPLPIAAADKIRVLNAAIEAGAAEIDVTSFVSSKLVPQLADGLAVLEGLAEGARLRVLAVNRSGVDRALTAHRDLRPIDRCGIPFSVSEAHNLANIRRTHAEHRAIVAEMVDALHQAGVAPLLGVATAFGCPLAGRIDPEQALAIIDWAVEIGVRSIMISDTTGMAEPLAVAALYGMVKDRHPEIELVAHFHDNRGAGLLNTLAAIGAGAETADSCLGGMGGEPRGVEQGVVGDQGNVVTEDLIAILDRMGVATSVDATAILAAGRLAEAVIGRPLFSRVQRAGLVMDA